MQLLGNEKLLLLAGGLICLYNNKIAVNYLDFPGGQI